MNLRTGTEVWKVVTNDRESVLPLFLRNKGGHEETIETLRKRRILKKYKTGSIIRAAKCAPPILCFETEKEARSWTWEYSHVLKHVKLIRVVGYQCEKVQILRFLLTEWLEFFKTGKVAEAFDSWPGTVGFRRVKVVT